MLGPNVLIQMATFKSLPSEYSFKDFVVKIGYRLLQSNSDLVVTYLQLFPHCHFPQTWIHEHNVDSSDTFCVLLH